MHPLLSKMLTRRVDRPEGAQPPPFDRTALSARGGMLDRREGENVSLRGSASAEGEFIVDVDYCNTQMRHVYFRPSPDAAMRYLGTVGAEDVNDLIEFVRAEQDATQDKAEFGAIAVGAMLLVGAAVGLFGLVTALLGLMPGKLGG